MLTVSGLYIYLIKSPAGMA